VEGGARPAGRRLPARRLRSTFPDHFAYDEATLRALAARADRFGAGLVTTEKDWVRLPPAWRAKVAAWPAQAVFADSDALDDLLAKLC
jgi:tetraacyldisaccharide 4'-kinase